MSELPGKTNTSADVPPAKISLPALMLGVGLMIVGSIWPFIFMNAAGQVYHDRLMLLMWVMIAGLVRGVGYIPHQPVFKALLSGWACVIGLIGWIILYILGL